MKKIEFQKEVEVEAIRDIQEFFLKERSEEISDFQAGLLLDFILSNIGPHLYNQAIADAQQFMSEKVEELYGLEKRRFK